MNFVELCQEEVDRLLGVADERDKQIVALQAALTQASNKLLDRANRW